MSFHAAHSLQSAINETGQFYMKKQCFFWWKTTGNWQTRITTNARDGQDNTAVQKCIWGIHNIFNLEVNGLQQHKDILYVPPLLAKIKRVRYLTNEKKGKMHEPTNSCHTACILVLGIWPPRMFWNIMFTDNDTDGTSWTPRFLFVYLIHQNSDCPMQPLLNLILSLNFKRHYW